MIDSDGEYCSLHLNAAVPWGQSSSLAAPVCVRRQPASRSADVITSTLHAAERQSDLHAAYDTAEHAHRYNVYTYARSVPAQQWAANVQRAPEFQAKNNLA